MTSILDKVLRRKSSVAVAPLLGAQDMIPDNALIPGDADLFDHKAIAERIAELAYAAERPLNIALFGPWGSGKSSVYTLMKQRMESLEPDARVVTYDAWKYGGQSLKRNFITDLARSLEVDDPSYSDGLDEKTETNTFSLWNWLGDNKASLALGLAMAIVVSALCLMLFAFVGMLTTSGQGFRQEINGRLAGGATVLGLVLAGLLVGPKALESANVKISRDAPSTDDQFAKFFNLLVQDVTKRGQHRLVVFIDELDRCAPQDVVATLVDLKTFLDQPGCVFVVAADREVLEKALQDVPQAKPVREDEPYYSTPGAFLDKIFQHQLALPPLRSHALTGFARTLVVSREGLWLELRDAKPGDRLFDDVVYTLIPAHVRSPRRVKVLLNNFATNARVAQARGISWLERATEIAKLTVFQTEFPAFAADLINYPRLVDLLLFEGDEEARQAIGARTLEQDRVLRRYSACGDEGPAGEHLVDAGSDGSKKIVGQADKRLKQELMAYLRKTESPDIPNPRPDLWYLRTAGGEEGIEDPQLGEVLDYASDTAPRLVIDAFTGRPSAQIRVAARLLAQRSDAEHGPGKANLITSACGLVQMLDRSEVEQVAAVVASSILVSVRQRDLDHSVVPGALTVGALAQNAPLVAVLLESLHSADVHTDDLLFRLVNVLEVLSDQDASRVHDLLASRYKEDIRPVHQGLKILPEHAARNLWSAARDVIASALSPVPGAAPPTPSPASVAGQRRLQTQPVVEEGEPPEEEDRLDPSEILSALLDCVLDRETTNEFLLSEAWTLGQTSSSDAVKRIARERAEDLMAQITDSALTTQHALLGIADGPYRDWDFWSGHLSRIVDENKATVALARVLAALPEAPLSVLEQLPVVAGRVATALGPRPALPTTEMVNAAKTSLAAIPWDDAATDGLRRRQAHATVASLATLLGEDGHALMGKDVADAIAAHPHTDEFNAQVDALIEVMPADVARDLEARLATYQAAQGEDERILLLRLRASTRFAGDPVGADLLLEHAASAGANQLVNTWLGLHPPVAALLTLVRADFPLPSRAALRRYVERLTPSERTSLWTDLQARDASRDVLKEVSAYGLCVEAVSFTRERLEAETQQPARSLLIDRLLDAPLQEADLKAAISDLAEYLLGKGKKGDAVFAADLVIRAGGAAYGKTGHLRSAFQAWEDKDDKTFTKSKKQQLVGLNLVKPKKGKVEKFLGDGLRAMTGRSDSETRARPEPTE